MEENTVYTIGHSTHPVEKFIGLLEAHGIGTLVDVRTIPKSRYNPQFQQAALKSSLRERGIVYDYIKDLGGLRRAHADSPNHGWRNSSFRGYADYMQTEVFEEALGRLMEITSRKRTAIMCAEAVPWRCHRSLIADALLVRAIPVMDIMPDGRLSAHKMTSFAQADGTKIVYPPENPELPGIG
ncbi:MAG TPA: DUF488 domain-containing protein [Micavibrio sp.]|nr:DUF488 domain-containing protein [Micavibrio sp.]